MSVAQTSTQQADDLTVIKGIKEARQNILRSLGILSYDDLAAASSEHVLEAFRAESMPVTLGSINGWIAEAGRLAMTRAAQRRTSGQGAQGEWHTIGLFIVEFQMHRDSRQIPQYRTRLHHLESDTDYFVEDVNPGVIWGYMGNELMDDAPHLAEALRAAVHTVPTTTPAESSAELRLRAVLDQVEALAVQQQSSPQASPGTTTENAPEPTSGFAGERLDAYLRKYGFGEAPFVNPAAERATAGAPMPSAALERTAGEQLQRYLSRYGAL